MAHGIEIWNASGVKTLAVTDRLSRFYGTASFSVSYGGTTSVSVGGFADDGTWFWLTPNATADGVVITPTSGGFSVSHNGFGPAIGGSYTIYLWRG